MKLRVLSDVVVAFAGLSEVAEDVVNPAGPRSAHPGSIVMPTNLCVPGDLANDVVNPAGPRSAHPGTIVGNMPINEVAEDVVNPAGPRSAHPGSIIMPTNLSVLGDLAEDVLNPAAASRSAHQGTNVGAMPINQIQSDGNSIGDDEGTLSSSYSKKQSQISDESCGELPLHTPSTLYRPTPSFLT